jgi:hypothetical protein
VPADAASKTNLADADTWNAAFIAGKRVGYSREQTRSVTENGRRIVRSTSFARLSLGRGGDVTVQDIEVTEDITPGGELIAVTSRFGAGAAAAVTRGKVKGDKLVLTQQTGSSAQQTSEIPWDPAWGGPFAAVHSLSAEPPTPVKNAPSTVSSPGSMPR